LNLESSTIENQHDPNWRGKVFVWLEQGLFLGKASTTSFHASPAIKIVIALDGEFKLQTEENGAWQNFRSAIIAPGQFHAIDGQTNKLALIVLVPEAKAAQPLIPILSRKSLSRIPVGVVQNFLPIFEEFDQMTIETVESEKICQRMLKKIKNGDELLSAAIDGRVSQSIERLREESENHVSVGEIAADVHLSESRFSHLFTEQIGVSVRRYQLWLRLRDAIHLLAGGTSLTATAHEAGFSDSAHLTRTFRQLLGIAPSALLKHSSLIVFPE
jgi:AraC-like DNA-binding protein